MLHQIDNEISAVQLVLALVRNETAMFLRSPQPTKSTRQRRGAVAGVNLAALAADGLLGGGIAVGGSDSCGLRAMRKMSAALPIFKNLLLIMLGNF